MLLYREREVGRTPCCMMGQERHLVRNTLCYQGLLLQWLPASPLFYLAKIMVKSGVMSNLMETGKEGEKKKKGPSWEKLSDNAKQW